VLRRRKTPDDPLAHVDPGATSPWFAPAVTEALESRRRYLERVDGLRPGPVRDRLERTRERLDAGVLAVWKLRCEQRTSSARSRPSIPNVSPP